MKLNFLDRAILYFSPKTAARRLYARSSVDHFVRTYESAGSGRRWKGIKAGNTNAEVEVSGGNAVSRNRARFFVRNNWMAGRGVDAVIANTIGHGIEASIKSQKAKSLWNDWARTTTIDVNGISDIFGLQQLAMGTIVESGDILIKKVRDSSSKIPLKIQLLESDYIDTSRNGLEASGNEIRNGIEFDAQGKVAAYWLFQEHPGGVVSMANFSKRQSTRYSISDVRLIYRHKRIGQVRGITWFHNIMLKMRDLDDYDDAQLFRQKIAACFTGFIETNELPLNTASDTSDPISEKMEPGIIEVLPMGKKITFSQPPGVGSDYDPFTKRQLMNIASGLGITYEALTGDYGNVNFSSGRMGWIEMYRNVEMWRWGMFIPQFCDVIWDWFIEACEVANLLDGSRVIRPTWTAPRREMIDPVKETQATKDQVRSGFMSYSEALRELGKDPESHMDEISQDFKKLDKLGLTIEADPRFNPKQGNSQTGDTTQNGQQDQSGK